MVCWGNNGRRRCRAHQDALVDVPVVAVLHAEPDDAGVRPLLVIDGPGGAGARGLEAPRAQVGVGGAGGEGGARGAGGGEEVLGHVVQRAGQRLRGEGGLGLGLVGGGRGGRVVRV